MRVQDWDTAECVAAADPAARERLRVELATEQCDRLIVSVLSARRLERRHTFCSPAARGHAVDRAATAEREQDDSVVPTRFRRVPARYSRRLWLFALVSASRN
jgi:hypothetical protein